MYCTIPEPAPSRGELSSDARRSYAELRRHARALGGVAASLRREAAEVASAYRAALSGGGEQAWSAFVRAADALAQDGSSAVMLLGLGESERVAASYFARIARENADLLPEAVIA